MSARVAGDDLLRALDRRAGLLAVLEAEGTDCLRLFHGIAEGAPGVAVDRYGSVLLVQTWRDPLGTGELERITGTVQDRLGCALVPCWNHRGGGKRAAFARWHAPELPAEVLGRERGVVFDARPRHRGRDPLWFVDLRAGRRRVAEWSGERQGASVLNLFAYTCGVGVTAAVAGAGEVWNVDFAESALAVGADNAARNAVEARFVRGDVFAVARQLAGLPVGGRYGKVPEFERVEPRQFDLVVLDPPRFAKSRFGVVDLVRDYQAVFKPALLATRPGGAMLCTNHVPRVDRDEWVEVLHRAAHKQGRALRDPEVIAPDEDFPSLDGRPPLKMAWFRVDEL